jgi:hypothetical protein
MVPSFVDAEVAAAVYGHKPLLIILPHIHNGAPNSSHKYYPALKLEELEAHEFMPLARIIQFLHGDAWQTAKLFTGILSIPGWAALIHVAILVPTSIIGFISLFFINVVAPFFGSYYFNYLYVVIEGFVLTAYARGSGSSIC